MKFQFLNYLFLIRGHFSMFFKLLHSITSFLGISMLCWCFKGRNVLWSVYFRLARYKLEEIARNIEGNSRTFGLEDLRVKS